MLKETKQQISKCLRSIAKGDRTSADLLYELVAERLFFIALKYLRDKESADEVLAEFWANIGKIAIGYRFEANAYSYLCKTLENMALMRLRQEKKRGEREVRLDPQFFEYYENANQERIEKNIENEQLHASFKKGFARLDSCERSIIYMIYWGNMTVRACAKELGISKSQVQAKKTAAVNKLKEVLTEDGWEGNEEL